MADSEPSRCRRKACPIDKLNFYSTELHDKPADAAVLSTVSHKQINGVTGLGLSVSLELKVIFSNESGSEYKFG